MNPDTHLDAVTINQLTWKPSVARNVAGRIVQTALQAGTVWPDEVDYEGTPSLTTADANCIGIAWRNLTRQGIIQRGSSYRRSHAENSRGRTIFCYGLASAARARTFLRQNQMPITERQQELL